MRWCFTALLMPELAVLQFLVPAIIMIGIAAVLILPYLHGKGIIGGKRPLKKGRSARAKILELEQSGVDQERGTADLKLLLEIHLRGYATYQLRVKRTVLQSEVAMMFTQGEMLNVEVAPGNMEHIAIPGLDDRR